MFFVGSVDPNDTYVVSETVTFYDDGTSRDFTVIKQQTLVNYDSKTDDKINEILNIDTEIKKETKVVKEQHQIVQKYRNRLQICKR